MASNHTCPHCGLGVAPLAHHNGPADCQVACRQLSRLLRPLLRCSWATETCWEFNTFQLDTDPQATHERLLTLLGDGYQPDQSGD
jgi:hypothetical protein